MGMTNEDGDEGSSVNMHFQCEVCEEYKLLRPQEKSELGIMWVVGNTPHRVCHQCTMRAISYVMRNLRGVRVDADLMDMNNIWE